MASVSIGSQFIEGKLETPMSDGRSRIVTSRVAPDLAQCAIPGKTWLAACRHPRVHPNAMQMYC